MKKDLVLGIDCSTTSCKGVAWNALGQPAGDGRCAIPLERPHPGWHEQPAESWWAATVQALRQLTQQVDPARLAGLSIAVQRETFVPVDAAGAPLRKGIVWMDERARAMLPGLCRQIGADTFHKISGKPLSGNLSFSKIAWIRQFEPELFSRTAYYLDVHAFLVTQLTGVFKTSWGCADPMGLFDMRENRWSPILLGNIGVNSDQMPAAFLPGTFLGEVSASAAQETGLPQGLPVFCGIGDGQAGALGAGSIQAGETCVNLGTAAVSATNAETYLTDSAFRTTYSGIPGAYLLETVLLGGTYTITWFLERFGSQPAGVDSGLLTGEAAWEATAAPIPPGADGLMVVPYWNSVMSPYWDAGASGMVLGWRGSHGPAHFYRAILEGIAYELNLQTRGVEKFVKSTLGNRLDQECFTLFGGGANSLLWRQILADITGKTIKLSPTIESTALGAGILAGYGAGWFRSIAAGVMEMAQPPAVLIQPDQNRHAVYHRLYDNVYSTIFPANQKILDRLTDLTEGDPSGW